MITQAQLAFIVRFHRDWGILLRPSTLRPDFELLSPEHEGRLVAEYGMPALLRYYCEEPPFEIGDSLS